MNLLANMLAKIVSKAIPNLSNEIFFEILIQKFEKMQMIEMFAIKRNFSRFSKGKLIYRLNLDKDLEITIIFSSKI